MRSPPITLVLAVPVLLPLAFAVAAPALSPVTAKDAATEVKVSRAGVSR